MATIFDIPDRHKKALAAIEALSDAQVDSLIDAMGAAKPSLTVSSFAKNVEKFKGLTEIPVEILVSALVSLCGSIHQDETHSIEELEQEIVSKYPSFAAGDKDVFFAKFKKLFSAAIKSKGVEVTAKAGSILVAHKNPYFGGRIISDIRPVFVNSEGVHPTAAAIVHNLEIETGSEQYIYVALDTNDLKKLQRILARALEKESQLVSVIRQQGLDYLSAED